MKLQTCYSREFKLWVAYMVNENGVQVGDAEYGSTKEYAAFNLGIEYSQNQHKFAIPLSELLGEPMLQPIS